MPYSCCTIATSLRFSSSEAAATDAGGSFTSSPITRGLGAGDPSATRTTPTSAPCPDSPSANATLKVASPQRVGGYVLRMPKLGEAAVPRPDVAEQLNDEGVFNVRIPTDNGTGVYGTSNCSARSQQEPSSSRTGWVPNDAEFTRPTARRPDERRQLARRRRRRNRPRTEF